MDKTTIAAPTREDRIFEIVAENAHQPRETLDRETSLIDILDSLGRVEVVMELEDEFELAIPENETDHILTIGQLIDEVEKRLRTKDGNAPPSS